jgi:hypothetical protein
MGKSIQVMGFAIRNSLLLSVLSYNTTSAQVVGSDIFIQGNYVEIGIASNGAFGSGGAAPVGYHPGGSTNLGFVSDLDKDGWATGSPNFYGDFFLPGTPQEGWAVSVAGTTSQAYRGVSATSMTGGLTGSNTSYVDSTYIKKAVWTGSVGNLSILQTTSLKPNDLFFLITVKLKNTGATDLTNVYYLRTVDPDNDQTLPGGSYTTRNKVVEKIPNTGNKVLVQAIGNVYTSAYLALAAKDTRAKPFAQNSGLTPTSNLNDLYNEIGTAAAYHYDTATYIADAAIGVIYNIGTLAAGDSTELAYAYLLAPVYIDTAFSAISTALPLQFTSFETQVANCMTTLRWNYNTDEKLEQLTVERSNDGRKFESIAQLPVSSTSFVDVSPTATQFYYRIKAKNIEGKSYYTQTNVIKINENCLESSAKILPNPANNKISISVSKGNKLGFYQIETAEGKTLLSGKSDVGDNATIDISSVTDGYYILRTKVNDKEKTIPFIIKH